MTNTIKITSNKWVFTDSEQTDKDLDSLVKGEGITALPAATDLGTPKVDHIAEKTASHGVSIDNKLTVKSTVQTVTALTPAGAGTSTCDLSLGNIFTLTMPADTQTLAISNETAGQCFIIEINNVTSQGALTWFTTIRWDNGTAPTLTGTNGKRDVFGFRVTGTDTYDGYIIGQNI